MRHNFKTIRDGVEALPLNSVECAFFKSLCDALVHAGALVDDNRQHVELAPVTFSRDPKVWGSVIRLEDL